MNSRLFLGEVMHQRFSPRQHGFRYKLFMFYLDLDELDTLHRNLKFFSRNRFNWFTFRDKHHVQFPHGSLNTKSAKQNVLDFLKSQGADAHVHRVMLLTHAAVLGYAFNPISVYFCFDENNNPLCAIAEVCNTHREMKMYLLDASCWTSNTFQLVIPKNFYVSPYSAMDASFKFIFQLPHEQLNVRVDEYTGSHRFLASALTGEAKKISDARLLAYGLKFPLITLKIIFLIHWQALQLRLRGLTFRPKNQDLHLQQNMFHFK